MGRRSQLTGVAAYLPARAVGQNIQFLVDTGASVTILSAKVYDRMWADIRPTLRPSVSPMWIEVADKSTVAASGEVTLTFYVGGKPFTWDVLIAPIADDGMLGLDFLCAHDFEFTGTGLWLQGRRVPLDWEGQLRPVGAAVAAQDEVLPACSESILTAIVPLLQSDLLLEPKLVTTGEDPGFMVARGLVSSADSRVPVRLINPGPDEVHVKAGTVLGEVWPLECQEVLAAPAAASAMKTASLACGPAAENELPDHLQELYEKSTEKLKTDEQEQLRALLLRHQDLFAKHPLDMGRTAVISHSIDTGGARPIKQPARRPPLAFADQEEKIISEQKAAGVIQESSSPWASPLVYVRKKDGSVRPCVDYRQVNAVTTKDAYPLPRIDDCLDCLNGASLFSTLDLQSGYWQIEVKEEDRPKTAFITRHGLYEYVTMPFGLSNAPSTFERCMELVLRGLQWKTLLIYLDDVIVYSSTVSQHLEQLEEVFQRLAAAGLKLKPSKCELLQTKVAFLGHVVAADGVRPDPSKVTQIQEWEAPRTVKELRSYLGLCSYYRRFIRGFAHIAAPLHRLTEKQSTYMWTPECQTAFETLQSALTSESLMAYPTKTGMFVLDTDASDSGIGAVLSQIQETSEEDEFEERPIAFASKSLTRAQRHYCVTRRELLAIVVFVQNFRHYLLGRKFLIRTDHSSLRWLLNFKNPTDQMARWLEILSQYDFHIQHRAGKKHCNADALSRIPEGLGECDEYDGQVELSSLPCGGCKVCERKHLQWSSVLATDDVVPLTGRSARLPEAPQITVTPPEEDAPSEPQEPEAEESGRVAFEEPIEIVTETLPPRPCHGLVYNAWLTILGTGWGLFVTLVLGALAWDLTRGTEPEPLDRAGHIRAARSKENRMPWISGYSAQELARYQKEDQDLAPALKWMEEKQRPDRDDVTQYSPATRNLWLHFDQLRLYGGVLYREFPAAKRRPVTRQLVVPRGLRSVLLTSLHDSPTGAHLGVKKTISKLKQTFYWYGFKQDVRSWVGNCMKCGARKRPVKTPRAPLKPHAVGAPLDRVAMDILGPFPRSRSGNKYVLVVQDQFTRWTEAYALPDYTAQTVAEVFVHQFVSRFGVPLEVHSDQGRNFEADLFKEMCRLLEIHKTRTTPYHPSSNGAVERFNATLANMISAYVKKSQEDWDEQLPLLTAAYRSSKHTTTKYTPNFLMLGREVTLPAHVLLGAVPPQEDGQVTTEYASDLQERLHEAFTFVREFTRQAQERQKKDYDTRVAEHVYQVGDAVFVRDDTRQVGRSPKLKADPWKGPAIVYRKLSDLLYQIRGAPKSKARVLHHDRLKPFPDTDLPGWAKKLQKEARSKAETPPKTFAEQATQHEVDRTDQLVQTDTTRGPPEPGETDHPPPAAREPDLKSTEEQEPESQVETTGTVQPVPVAPSEQDQSGLRRSPRQRRPPQRYGQ